jgi:aspartyl-tRNA(Asn)/glutamyl-tRNA(Gln) amidotransferase subunit A
VSELTRLPAVELQGLLNAGEVSSVDVVSAHLERINAVDDTVGAFLHVSDHALEDAKAIDDKRAQGETLPATAGLPIAVKDVLCTTDMPTTSGSKILEGWTPPYDATVVRKYRDAGMVALGKTNMDEFAMGSSTEHSGYHRTANPWDVERIPGGSGGGSAAAVSAFEAPLALGSDTGGSIRQPAAVTGTVGFKPTYGGVSRYGVIALASSLDQVGPVSRSVVDAALLHDVISGHDPHDSTSIQRPWDSMLDVAVRSAAEPDLTGVKLGRVKQLDSDGFQSGVQQRFHELLELASSYGAEIIDIDAPHFDYAVAAYYLILPAEASSNLAKYDSVRFGLRVTPEGGATVEDVMAATREAGFGDEVKRRIILGTYALSAGYYDAYYGKAQKVRTLIQRDFAEAFSKVDALITPTAPTTAFRFGEQLDNPLTMWANDMTTIPANLAGVPGLALPMGLAPDDGLPVGAQLMAPAYEDHRLFDIGAALEALIVQRDGTHVSSLVPEPGQPRGQVS